jgi:hypothetical protein
MSPLNVSIYLVMLRLMKKIAMLLIIMVDIVQHWLVNQINIVMTL